MAYLSDVEAPEAVDSPDPRSIFGSREFITPRLIQALIQKESSGKHYAVGDEGKSVGLGQLGKLAWDDVVKFYPQLKPYSDWGKYAKNPKVNLLFTEGYLNLIGDRYLPPQKRTIENVLAAYNMGPGRFRKLNYKPIPRTQKYISDIMKMMQEGR